MIALADFFVILISILILIDYSRGFFAVLLAKLFIPIFVRFTLGPVNIDVFDLWIIFLFISIFFHRVKINELIRFPLFKLFSLYCTLLVIIALFSTKLSFGEQFLHIIKSILFQDFLLFFYAYLVFSNEHNKTTFLKYLTVVCFICGLYGIFVYLTQQNLYVDSLSKAFTGQTNIYSDFLFDARMGLKGRTSGTLPHPLSWAQHWCIIICFIWLIKNHIKKSLCVSLLLLGFINVFLSGSRAAFLCLIPLFWNFFIQANLLIKTCLILIATASTVGVLGVTSNFNSLFKTVVSLIVDTSGTGATGSSSTMRLSQIENMLSILKGRDFLFGYGYGFLSSESVLRESLAQEMRGFESVIFQKIFDTGIVGCVVFFGFIKKMFEIIKKYLEIRDSSLTAFFSSYLIAIIVTGIQGTFSFFLVFAFIIASFVNNSVEEHSIDSELVEHE